MKLSTNAIERPRIVAIGCILVFVVSCWSALMIPVQRAPAISKAVVMCTIPYPGAEPTEVEQQVTRKIEERIQRLDNIEFIASTSMRGVAVVQVIFLDGEDPESARIKVKDMVDEARGELPQGRQIVPGVNRIDYDNTPLILVNLIAPDGFDEAALKQIAEEVRDEIDPVTGVAGTQVFGGREREIHVDVNLDLAAQYGLTLVDVQTALNQFHAERPGGSLDTGSFDPQIISETKFQNTDDIGNAIVSESNGRVTRIRDVAKISDTYERIKNVSFLDGKDCATIMVYKESDINTLAAVTAIQNKIKELKPKYPAIQFTTTRDSSEEIQLMFRVLGSSFIFGALLIVVILGWTMGLRIATLVLLAIPFSSGVGLSCLYWLEVPLSSMVVFSFILVVGMVVDGAIIVAENIHRHIERGLPPVEAAKIGIEEVGKPVIMADLTTVAAYLPMLLVPGIMGDFMGVMPIVVGVSLIGSIIADHFVIPVIAARWYRQKQTTGNPETIKSTNTSVGEEASNKHQQLAIRPNLGSGSRLYRMVLNWGLNNRWAIVTCGFLAVAWAVIMSGKIGSNFMPQGDVGQIQVKYELPLGSSVHQTIAYSKIITDSIEVVRQKGIDHGTPEVRNFVSAIGSSEGLASRLENDPAVGPEFGTIMVQLISPMDRLRHETEVMEDLRHEIDNRLDSAPGLTYKLERVEEGPPGGFDVAIRLEADDHKELGRVGAKLVDELKRIGHTFDVGMDYRPENPAMSYRPNEFVLPFFNINEADINNAIYTAINGDDSIVLSIDDEDVPIRVQAADQFRKTRSELGRMMIRGSSGKMATLDELCDVRRTQSVYAVNRYDLKPSVTVRCMLDKEKVSSETVFDLLRDKVFPRIGFQPNREIVSYSLMGFDLTPYVQALGIDRTSKPMKFSGKPGTTVANVRAKFTGENEEFQKNFVSLQVSMIIAVVLIFAILVFQFNSFRQALIVIITVPFSFIGVIAGSYICGFPFSLATFIGLISLAGVVVNDAIVVVDFINQARERGLSKRDAIIEAGLNRLRPVLLTTITTVGGLLPLFLNLTGGAEFWQPLCGAVVFGLLFATLLTLLAVPVAYDMVYWGTERQKNPLRNELK